MGRAATGTTDPEAMTARYSPAYVAVPPPAAHAMTDPLEAFVMLTWVVCGPHRYQKPASVRYMTWSWVEVTATTWNTTTRLAPSPDVPIADAPVWSGPKDADRPAAAPNAIWLPTSPRTSTRMVGLPMPVRVVPG